MARFGGSLHVPMIIPIKRMPIKHGSKCENGDETLQMLGAWPKGEECEDHMYWVRKVQVCISLTSA
jgi:hypothetical protein